MATPAFAQGLLTNDQKSLFANGWQEDFPPGEGRADGGGTGLSFSDMVAGAVDQAGFSVNSQSGVELHYLPADPGLGGNFRGIEFSGAASFSGQKSIDGMAGANCQSVIGLFFTLDAPVEWEFVAQTAGGTSGFAAESLFAFGLHDMDTHKVLAGELRTSNYGGDPWSDIIVRGGQLPAGHYLFEASIQLYAFLWNGKSQESAWASMLDGRFTLGAVPTPGAGIVLAWPMVGMGRRRR